MTFRRLVGGCFLTSYVVCVVTVVTAVSPGATISTANGIRLASVFDGMPAQLGFVVPKGKAEATPCNAFGSASAALPASSGAVRGAASTRNCAYCSFLPRPYGCYEPPCNPTLCSYTGTTSDGCSEYYGGCGCARDIDCPGCGI